MKPLSLVFIIIVLGGCAELNRDPAVFGRIELEEMNRAVTPSVVAHNNGVRITAYKAYQSGSDYTAVIDSKTYEGGTVPMTLSIRKGVATITMDFLHDSHARGATIVRDDVKNLRLGWFKGADMFVEVSDERIPTGTELFLRLSLDARGEMSF